MKKKTEVYPVKQYRRKRLSPKKIFGVTFGMALVMFGLGFVIGSIIGYFVK